MQCSEEVEQWRPPRYGIGKDGIVLEVKHVPALDQLARTIGMTQVMLATLLCIFLTWKESMKHSWRW